MRLAQAMEALEQVGLTRYEAKVFVNLGRAGAATAAELARASGVNRMQAYRALESLEARGLVEVSLDRPRRYASRAINEIFELFVSEKQEELERIEEVRKELLGHSARIFGGGRALPSVRLQVIKGRSQVYRALRRGVEQARKEILSFTTTKGLQRSFRAEINVALLEAMRRGVRPRFIAEIRKANLPLMDRIARNAPLRHLEGQRARFLVVDNASVLTFLIQDERTIRGDAETALWTNSPDFVEAHAEFFEKAWGIATPAEARIAELR
jgi:HTH-type transcriptional regulator, sugar sensing transcriptional regulator